MPIHAMVRRLCLALVLGACCAFSISCAEHGTRTEVYPGMEGDVTVRHVPVDQSPEAQGSAGPAPTASSDDQLAGIEALWPRLSPQDRQRVLDMAKRFAQPAQ